MYPNVQARDLARNTGRLLALNHKHHRKQWTPEERFELVSKVLAGFSIHETACNAGINSGQLYQWVNKYSSGASKEKSNNEENC